MAITKKCVSYYIENHLSVLPIPSGEKAPTIKNWNSLEITDANIGQYFTEETVANIGIKLGASSSNLADVDLDHPTAVMLAPKILPATVTFGRASNPSSHWQYQITSNAPTKTQQYKDETGKMLVELRWEGGQTVFPPSIHPSGEMVMFDTHPSEKFFDDVYKIDGDLLNRKVKYLAAVTLLTNNWPEKGSRQNAALALSGYLLSNNLDKPQVEELLAIVAGGANDEESAMRIATVQTTADKIAANQPVTGYQHLNTVLGEKVVKLLSKWLDLKYSPSIASTQKTLVTSAAPPWPELQDISIPDGFQFGVDGLYRIDGKGNPTLISGPIIVKNYTLSAEGNNAGRLLRFRTLQGNDTDHIFRDAELHGQNPLSALTDKAFKIIPSQIRHVSDYLMSFNTLETLVNAPETGWQHVKTSNETVFVTPNETWSRSGLDVLYLPDRPGTVNRLASSGTLDQWQTKICTQCKGNPLLVFGLCASFAGSILFWIGAGPQGYHFYGTTSRGKTTLMQVSASVWGDASDPDKANLRAFVQKWNATANAIEGMAASFTDTSFCLDELGTTVAQDVGKLIYNLISGTGKQAMDSSRNLRHVRTWSSVILSTGEVAIRFKIEEYGKKAKGGQLLRFMDIPVGKSVFDTTHGMEDGDFSNHLKAACAEYYGTAGAAFVKALLQSQVDDASLRQDLKQQIEESKSLLRSDMEQELKPEQRRVLDRLGVILLAGLLAARFGVVPFSEDEIVKSVRHVRDLWLDDSHDISDVSRAIVAIITFLQTQASRFKKIPEATIDKTSEVTIDDEKFDPREMVGFVTHDQYFVFPEVFRNEVCSGFDCASVCDELKALGFLATQGGDRHISRRSTPLNPRTSVYVLNKTIIAYEAKKTGSKAESVVDDTTSTAPPVMGKVELPAYQGFDPYILESQIALKIQEDNQRTFTFEELIDQGL